MSWWFYINATGCVGVTGYWSDKIFIISPKENIVFFLNYLEYVLVVTYFPHVSIKALILLLLLERGQIFEVHMQGNFLH